MTNKILTFMLAVLMSMVTSMASAQDFTVGGIYYKIWSSTDLTVAVTYRDSDYPNWYSGDVVIPDHVIYKDITYCVTSIGSYAFYGCTGLTSVTIPNSVTEIGDFAFYNCI